MQQATIAVNGIDTIDLSLRNALKEDISNMGIKKEKIPTEWYIKLLSYVGKEPNYIKHSHVDVILKPKYRYTYHKGGFMVMHRDTIKGPTHIGTYVKVIQKAKKGGGLFSSDEYPEDPLMGDSYEYQLIPINVDHEVTEVIEGTRITEVYEIHIKDINSVNDIKTTITEESINTGITKLNEILTSSKYNEEFKSKYNNYKYVVFGNNLDPFECAKLKMFMNVFNVHTFITTIVTQIDNHYIYRDYDCYFLGGETNYIYKTNEYNDEGYTKYRYVVINVLEIRKD